MNRTQLSMLSIAALAVLLFSAAACGGRGGEGDAAEVYFKNLKDGDTVSSPVRVEMGVRGMEVKAAGEIVAGTGHHHIVINGGPISSGTVIPNDETHRHFGKGQTETELELAPGKYKLTLQFADGSHQSYGEALSASVNITVE